MYYKLEGDRQLWSLRDYNSRGAVKQRISLQYYDSMTSIGEAVTPNHFLNHIYYYFF